MKHSVRALFLFFKALLFSLVLTAAILSLFKVFCILDEKNETAAEPTLSRASIGQTKTVILDAGHGGVDSGALTPWGDEEKHLNLAVVKKIGAFLEEAGISVLYTRTEDVLLTSSKTTSRKMGDLTARADFAKENPNATFVSIHMNTLPAEKYKGLQVFYSENNGLNKVLALQIQNDAKTFLQPDNKREVKNAKGSIFILDRMNNPAVLIECGFLSNHEEAALLLQDEYQNKLAFSISRSLISFLLQKEIFE